MANYIRKALNALADSSGEQQFRTAANLIWYGAILSIIIVGFFLIWVAFIILAIAFFSLKIAPTTPQYSGYAQPYQTTPPTNTKANFCPTCGTPVASDATFCAHCGKQI